MSPNEAAHPALDFYGLLSELREHGVEGYADLRAPAPTELRR